MQYPARPLPAWLRGHFAEVGIVVAVGRKGVEELLDIAADPRMIRAWHRSSEMSMRLDEAPGIGPVLATAPIATVVDPSAFRSGRNFSAWIGLVPKQHSSGGKNRLGSISKQGDRYLLVRFLTSIN